LHPLSQQDILNLVESANTKISVLRGNHLVPLIPTIAPDKASEQPWRHALLERHKVGAIEIPEHTHGEFCLHLQLTGAAAMEWWSEGQNRLERTAPGSMILLAPGTQDRLRWQGDSERLILSLNPVLLQNLANHEGELGPLDFRNRWSFEDGSLAHLMTEMGRERASGWRLGKLYADLLELDIAHLMLRRYAATPIRFADRKGHLPAPKLRRSLDFITDNLDRDLRLDEIAKQVDLSPAHFAREFKRTVNRTPYQYLLDQRISRAKSLLKITNRTVQEIGLQSGFSSPVNFVRAFRERVGVTPGAWQKNPN